MIKNPLLNDRFYCSFELVISSVELVPIEWWFFAFSFDLTFLASSNWRQDFRGGTFNDFDNWLASWVLPFLRSGIVSTSIALSISVSVGYASGVFTMLDSIVCLKRKLSYVFCSAVSYRRFMFSKHCIFKSISWYSDPINFICYLMLSLVINSRSILACCNIVYYGLSKTLLSLAYASLFFQKSEHLLTFSQ